MHEVKPYRRAHPHSRLLLFESVLFLAFIVFLFFLLGFATGASAAAVLLAFAPSLIFGIVLIALIQSDHFQPAYNWFVLAALLVIFGLVYFLMPSPTVQGLDGVAVLGMNAILCCLALLILHTSYSHEPVVHEQEIHHHEVHHEHHTPAVHVVERVVEAPTPSVQQTVVHVHTPARKEVEAPAHEDILQVIHGVEDKAKALNFVIGRVYSVYHGGTDKLRNRVRIDKTWYAEFNEIDAKDSGRRRAQAIVLLGKIKDRLELLKKSEKDIFGDDASKLRNIKRSADGRDRVIDVLVRNDKDPVQQYYDGALSFCTDAIKKLGDGKSVDSVVPRTHIK